MEMDGVPPGFHGLDGKAFRSKVKQLIDDSSAPDLQSFCYWTLYHAFHLWKSEQYVFGKSQKDETQSEMSAAQWLVELKTQSEVIDTDVRNVSSEKLAEQSSAGQTLVSVPESISKSEDEKDLCFSDSVFVRRRGNALFPLDGVALSSSELAQESASGSPLSVVFPWSPRTWTQGTSGAIEAVDTEGIITNHKEHNRNAGILASARYTENEMELHCRPFPQMQRSAAEEQQESPSISLEVYLGDNIDVFTEESQPIPSSIADMATYSSSECAAKDSMKERIIDDFTNTIGNPDKNAIRREVSVERIKGKRRIGREGGERASRRYKALATVCS